jgi:hypothetical protein
MFLSVAEIADLINIPRHARIIPDLLLGCLRFHDRLRLSGSSPARGWPSVGRSIADTGGHTRSRLGKSAETSRCHAHSAAKESDG